MNAAKILDQTEFVKWWGKNITVHQHNEKVSRDLGTLSMEKAESETGIQNQTVCRWRKYLADPKAYRKRLAGAAYRAVKR